jgi:hypothetical protein
MERIVLKCENLAARAEENAKDWGGSGNGFERQSGSKE